MSETASSIAARQLLTRPLETHTPAEQVHVTRYMARHPERFPSSASEGPPSPSPSHMSRSGGPSPSLSHMSRSRYTNGNPFDLSKLPVHEASRMEGFMRKTQTQWNMGRKGSTPRADRSIYDESISPRYREYDTSRLDTNTPSPRSSPYIPAPTVPFDFDTHYTPRSKPARGPDIDDLLRHELAEYQRHMKEALERDVNMRRLFWHKIPEEERR